MPASSLWSTLRRLSMPLLLIALAGCGGGGNELGPVESIWASPEAVQVGAKDSCFAGVGPTVHVYGGMPPYALKNSAPRGMTLDRARVDMPGEGFTLRFSGLCLSNMPITIEDAEGRLLAVPISNQPI
jgi:hypothetical protein